MVAMARKPSKVKPKFIAMLENKYVSDRDAKRKMVYEILIPEDLGASNDFGQSSDLCQGIERAPGAGKW